MRAANLRNPLEQGGQGDPGGQDEPGDQERQDPDHQTEAAGDEEQVPQLRGHGRVRHELQLRQFRLRRPDERRQSVAPRPIWRQSPELHHRGPRGGGGTDQSASSTAVGRSRRGCA